MDLLCLIQKGQVDNGVDFVDKLVDVDHVGLQLSELLVIAEN